MAGVFVDGKNNRARAYTHRAVVVDGQDDLLDDGDLTAPRGAGSRHTRVTVADRSQSRSRSRIWFAVTDRRQVADHSRVTVAGHGGDLSPLAGAIVTSFGGALANRAAAVAGVV